MKNNSKIKNIAVFTSGGDAPGMNAAIRAVVRTCRFYNINAFGINRGYDGMVSGDMTRLDSGKVANIIHRGGTILKTARSESFRTKEGRLIAFNNLKKFDIDACVAIGGNGTYTGAMIFGEEHNIPIVGIPGTIDNDIAGTDYTIGFDTAINTATEAIDKIRDTADSHNRLFFIEVMGRHAGFIALNTGIGSGAAKVFLPEVETKLDHLIDSLRKSAERNKLFNLVIVAEGNMIGSTYEISEIIKTKIPEYDIRVAIIGHLQRGGSPTCFDRVLASRLGHSAVESLINGMTGKAIGLVNNSISYTDFKDAIFHKKSLNEDLLRMAEILAM